MRLDIYLAENGFVKSRTRAQNLISAGQVTVDGVKITKPSFNYEGGEVLVLESDIQFVGRGGLKLDGAIAEFELEITDFICCDIGASSGGFTDCMLKRGAKKVYAVDCGSNQLDESLVNNPNVVNMENFNARYLDEYSVPEKCDLVTMDVSFISQTLIHPAVTKIIKKGGAFITLIKPPFEVGRQGIGKGGIVKKQSFLDMAIARVCDSAKINGFEMKKIINSPIRGGDGNREYIGYFVFKGVTE